MEKEVDPEVIKSTQIALGKYVKRPPLSEKLLKKPPFRFLHDVITTVLKTTGFFDKLFDEEELISDNVKDRDSKISFLSKVIFVISSTTGKSLSVKPSKIVAGQESEKTNELLQCLALALDNKLSSDKAVRQYKDNLKSAQEPDAKTKEPSKSIKKTTDSKKSTSKVNEKFSNQKTDISRTTSKQDKEKFNDVKSKRKENGSIRGESQKTQQSKMVTKNKGKNIKEMHKEDNMSRTTSSTLNTIDKEKSSISLIDKEKVQNVLSKNQSHESDLTFEKDDPLGEKIIENHEDSPAIKKEEQDNPNTSYTINENDLNSTGSSDDLLETRNKTAAETESLGSHNNTEEIEPNDPHQNELNIHNDNKPTKSLDLELNISNKTKNTNNLIIKETDARTMDLEKEDSLNAIKIPVTAENDIKYPRPQSVRPHSVRPSSSRPGAPRMRERVDNVIKDTDNLLIGKVNIIAENTQNEEEEDTSLVIMEQGDGSTAVVQDQQDLKLSSSEHGHLVQQILDSQKELSQVSGKTEIEWQFGAQRAREAMNQDVEQLRFNIQALSRVANPLGKLLDHIQEDVEVMRQELQQWSNIYEEVNKEMLKQKTLNEDSLMPFHTKLKQLDSDIEEKHGKINDLKILIHKNANRIEKLLSSGSV
ncbi:unnamed protein product [Arctia plantaginis]|uniref:TRAF3-interacting protein 1 n=1 Tax=Arctia plantaginis TaxID=874455 RepID=A0A8S1AVG4_ARCPL|nr:unnamed protein product [Arctia plantaginis]